MKKIYIATLTLMLIVPCNLAWSASDTVFPKPVSSALPMYPESARVAHVSGNVKVSFVLNKDGSVVEAKIVSGNPLLTDAALKTVKSWRFRPQDATSNLRYDTDFVFVLNAQPKRGEPKLTVSMKDFRHVEVVSELYVEAIE